MYRSTLYPLLCFMLLCIGMDAQTTTKVIDNFSVTTTQAVFHGKSKSIRESIYVPATTKEKKQHSKINNRKPDNFKGRKNQSSAVDFTKEHQGPDPVRQSTFNKSNINQMEVLVNRPGFGNGSPTDPTGDVSNDFYVQAVNATSVGVFNREGILEGSFPMNTLWAQFGFNSAGDPIVLFDEITQRWILTEFTFAGNLLLIAISDTSDPLGTYNSFSFSTPNFPDYPKYSLTPDALVATTNEEGRGTLHQYFISKDDLFSNEGENARIQRIAITGTAGSEQTFIVSTPVDWNGPRNPVDSRPIVMKLNDSSWGGGPIEDQVELYTFDVDFDNPNNTEIEQTNIVTAPYDAFPCSATGVGFACIPQMNGAGLDGIPEIIMHVPHQRNFGTHESLVYCHVTDVTDGENLSGIRWVELRRDSENDWSVYQQGTFAPDDGLDRFMGSIAIDENGTICLGYSVSSPSSFAGIRATGRNDGDPLGEMTYQEVILREGQSTIVSGGRFGDYPQMSVVPGDQGEFWFTTEYAGGNGTVTNISAVQLQRPEFDLAARSFITPTATATELSTQEAVVVEIINNGLNEMSDFNLELELDGEIVSTSFIAQTLSPGDVLNHTFPDNIDLSVIRDYNFRTFVSAPMDQNALNDTLALNLSVLPNVEAGISAVLSSTGCDNSSIMGSVLLENFGSEIITQAIIGVTVDGVAQPNISYKGSISNGQGVNLDFDLAVDTPGNYDLELEILELNSQNNDFDASNNVVSITAEVLGEDNFVTVVLQLDDYPNETRYTITSQNTGVVLADEAGFTDAGRTFETKVCLSLDSCYNLTLFDSYGDGLCCNFGNGSIAILDNAGNPIVSSDGVFQFELSIDFCAAAGSCNLNAEIDVTPSSSANDNDGILMITAVNGVGPFSYSIDGGVRFQDDDVFTNLIPGDYNVVVTDANSICVYEETVTLDFNVATFDIAGTKVNVDILPNPTDGVFKINIQDLPTTEDYITVSIFDIQGKFIQYKKLGKFNNDYIGSFSLYSYPSGTYLVKIESEVGTILEKVVKQ